MRRVHISPYAGSWYPEDPAELEDELRRASEKSSSRVPIYEGQACGFVVPHAAPAYSGVVASAVYRALAARKPRRVILLGFSHSVPHEGVTAPEEHTIRTPLGDLPLEEALFSRAPLCDHSVEIQLPFLQVSVPGVKIEALYVGDLSLQDRAESAAVLRNQLDRGTVLIASSDFTHYGRRFGYMPFPVDEHTPVRLDALDRRVMDAMSRIDAQAFLAELRESGSTLCGYNPIALLLETVAPMGPVQHVLDYQKSGEITGDWHHSVSYAALGYYAV
jgi:AmmeMemoRadiSam system protein B